LQARPTDGRALSLGSESQVDSDLSAFAYELAARVGRSPTFVSPLQSELPPAGAALPTHDFIDLIGEWKGTYNEVRSIRLTIQENRGNSFTGRMAYPREGIVTVVEGTVHAAWSRDDVVWAQINDGTSSSNRIAVSFKETAYEGKGSSPINFEGEYRAIVASNAMRGAWFTGNRLVGVFTLRRAATPPNDQLMGGSK
jgi:hypothetical protein